MTHLGGPGDPDASTTRSRTAQGAQAPALNLPRIATWDAWGAVFTDVQVWAAAVRAIARRAELPVHTIEPGYPGTNAVFVVNRRSAAPTAPPFVVKIYAPFCHEDYTIERELHPLLTQYPALPVPALLHHGVLAEAARWPYLVLTFLPGKPIREVRTQIPRPNRVEIARDLGQRIGVLHAIPTASLKALDASPEAWRALAPTYLAQTLAHLRRETALPPHLVDALAGFAAPVLDRPGPTAGVLVSGDLTEDHLLLRQDGPRWTLSGLIDFADAVVAPRDYEWPALWFGALDRDPAGLQAFMAAYDPHQTLDQGFYHRAMAFTVLHEFGGLMIAQTLRRLGDPAIQTPQMLLQHLWGGPA